MILLLLSVALAADATPLAGNWNVVTTWMSGTCPTDASTGPGSTSAYQWLISTQPDGLFTIAAQGQTVFPLFAGTVHEPDHITAIAYAEPRQDREGSWLVSSTTIEMALKDGVLTGTRMVQQWVPLSGLFPGFPLHIANAPCFTGGSFIAKH